MRHADAGYPEALACAAEHGLQLPMARAGSRSRGAAQ
jgi:urocanate hydratase